MRARGLLSMRQRRQDPKAGLARGVLGTQAEELDGMVHRREARLSGYFLRPLLDGAALDLDAATADAAGQVVVVDRGPALPVEDLARRVTNRVHVPVLGEHLQVAVDGGEAHVLAPAAKLGMNLLGAAEARQASERGGKRCRLLRPAYPRASRLLLRCHARVACPSGRTP